MENGEEIIENNDTTKKGFNKLKSILSPRKKEISALDAYTKSKYGEALTEEEMYNKCLVEIEETIIAKCNSGQDTLLYGFDNAIVTLEDKLVKHYKDLGYNVVILDSKISSCLKSHYLLITWAK